MSEPDFPPLPGLREARVAILGLGLMGGSLALALRGRCAALVGMDPDPETLSLARRRAVVDHAEADAAEILPGADLVLMAAPVGDILELISRLPQWHPGRAAVIDLGSTKTDIVRALDTLPPRFDPLGGHPMCGRELAGLANADPVLFQGATFAFTPSLRSSPGVRRLAEELARIIGAHPLWLDPETHDRWTASTSHLPYLMAVALVQSTPGEARALVGPGFHGATRLAGSSPGMMFDVLTTNRVLLQEALGRFRERLDTLEDLLSREENEALRELLYHTVARRAELIGL